MRIATYIRVSTEKQRQQGESLESQRALLEAYARRQNWSVTHRYQESASTWSGTRDQYDQMMDDARARRFEAILVWKLDRFGRRSSQIHAAIEELKLLGVDLILVSENVNLTQDGIVGKVLTSALALAADLENEMRAERSRVASHRRKEMGLFPLGQLPSGYRHTAAFQPTEIDEEVAPGVRRGFELYATGRYSIMDVAHMLNDAGHRLKDGTAYTYRNLRYILNNEHYTGFILMDGERVQSREPALIDEALFERVQRVMRQHAGAPRSAARRFRPYLLKGLLFCLHCGSKMFSQTTGSEPYRYAYYKCGGEQLKSEPCPASDRARTLIREDSLAPEVDELVESISLPPDWQAGIQAYLDRDTTSDVLRRRERMEGKLARLNELYVEGYIDKAEFSRKRNAYYDELAELVVPDRAMVVNAGKYLGNIKLLWDRTRTGRRNEFLRAVFSRMVIDRITQHIISVETYPEFLVLFNQVAESYREEMPGCAFVFDRKSQRFVPNSKYRPAVNP